MGGRKQTSVGAFSSYRDGPRFGPGYRCEWSTVVGSRVRRERRARDLTLVQFSRSVRKLEDGYYSPGYFSRLERGWASAPLYVYLAIADALGVEPGRLLGPDDVQTDATGGEMTLVRFLRDAGIPPHEALRAVVDAQAASRSGPSGANSPAAAPQSM